MKYSTLDSLLLERKKLGFLCVIHTRLLFVVVVVLFAGDGDGNCMAIKTKEGKQQRNSLVPNMRRTHGGCCLIA